jgi:hypothetical protein
MAFASESDRSERERDERDPPTLPPSPAAPSDATAAHESMVDDALRIAVEALSAEICWFVANDAGARGVFVRATGSRPPTP